MTPSEAVAVGTAGGRNVDPETQTPEQARETVRQDMGREARRLDIRLADNALDEMADRFIERLRAMGAFRQEEQEAQETAAPAEEQGQSSPEANNPEPSERSFAQRFLGGN